MSVQSRMRTWWRAMVHRERLDVQVNEELQFHIESRTEDLVREGVPPVEAARRARAELGSASAARENSRQAWGTRWFDETRMNLRYALRMLARNQGFTAIAILALALGIGPNVAIFSIVWATFLKPLPYPQPDRMVVVWSHYKGERRPVTGDDYAEIAAESHSFQFLGFESWFAQHLTNPDHSQSDVTGLPFTPGFYSHVPMCRIILGRDFLPSEGTPGNDHYILLSSLLWKSRYQSDPHIVGKSVLVDDEPYTVVGVDDQGPADRPPGSFAMPLVLTPGAHSPQIGNLIGRLKPGVTVAQAQAEMSLIYSHLAAHHGSPAEAKFFTISVEPFHNDWLDHKVARNLWLLLAAVGLVLLIACANVANLLLARGSARQQELAVRSALGASRRQVFVQLLTESFILALFGGAAGVALGWTLLRAAIALMPHMPIEVVVKLDMPVLMFAVGASSLSGVLFGCAPAWHATRINLSETLKQGGRSISSQGRGRTLAILVSVEFALALTLLGGAGMALHSFWNLRHIDLGMDADHVVTAFLRPLTPGHRLPPTPPPAQIVAIQRQFLERLLAAPGITSAALATRFPLSGYAANNFTLAGQAGDPAHLPTADLELVTPGFFNTFGIRLAKGRFFTDADTTSTPLDVVVNETFVRRYLPNVDPLSARIVLLKPPAAYQIIGVFHDVDNSEHLTGAAQPAAYLSLWQNPFPWYGLAVHSALDPAATTESIHAAVRATMTDRTLEEVQFMDQIVDTQLVSDRFVMVLFAAFAVVALLLAGLGIYGVIAFLAVQRTHEIGIRMALGAQRQDVVRMVLAGGLRLACIGALIGLAGVLTLGRLMHATLYGVHNFDFTSTALVVLILMSVAALACWIPARRSARVDPIIALREN